MSPIYLLVVGLTLIFIEFYVPGAIIGTMGGLLVLASLIVFIIQTDSPLAALAYTLGIAVASWYLVKFAMWRIRNTRPENSIYSDSSQVGYQASSYDHSAVGKVAVVFSDLKPGGYILVDGKQLQAISQTGYITKGSEVMIVGGQEESLIVIPHKKLKKEDS